MSHRKSEQQKRRVQQVKDLLGNTHKLPSDYPVAPEVLAAFLQEVTGRVIFPGDPDYDAARTEFNPAFPRFPKIIVFCVCLADVRACLKWAHDVGMHAVARAGRHSLAGYSVCDGMVIDVSEINSVVIDAVNREATVGAGIQFERFNANLQSYGLHVPGGGCPTVCVAGYMQGGGYGFTSREFGIHSDNVIEFTMVLADGRVVVASEAQNADLFWAVRGGTGNQFGILVQVRYKLYPLGKVSGIRLDWNVVTHPQEAAQALETIQNAYIRSSEHNKLGFQTTIGKDINAPTDTRVMFLGLWTGDKADFDEVLKPLLDIPGHQVMKRMYDHYSTVDEALLANLPPIPDNTYSGLSQSRYFARDLTAEEWGKILEFAQTAPNDYMMIDMEAYGGAINDYPVEKSAFIHRDVTVDFFCDVFWEHVDDEKAREENSNWLQSLMEFVEPFSNGHSYQNYPNRLQTDWRWAYFGKYYNTLQWVKAKYDPGNFFHYEQSISTEPDDTHDNEYAPLLFDDPDIVAEDY